MDTTRGKSTKIGYYEKTPLDRAIDEYQKRADEYFQLNEEVNKLPPDVRNQRQMELKQAKAYLEHQRMNAENYAAIQAGLDSYREAGRNATKGTRDEVVEKQAQLLAERHHPTDDLAKLMIAAGKVKPSSVHSPHHIVPGKGKTKEANLARVHMHRFGIRINDPDNGVWLPRYKKHTPHWSMPQSRGHLEYHTKSYERWLERKLRSYRNENSIREQLDLVGRLLQINKLPDEAR